MLCCDVHQRPWENNFRRRDLVVTGKGAASQINPELVAYSLGACHRAFIQAKGKLSLAMEHQLFLGQTNMSTAQLAVAMNCNSQAAVRDFQALATSLASAFLAFNATNHAAVGRGSLPV